MFWKTWHNFLRIKNKHHLRKCLPPTLLSIWHGHNDGLTYSTCWNGVQISKLNSICNYCDDVLTPWTNYLLNCTIHRFCSNYFLRSHYWKKKKKWKSMNIHRSMKRSLFLLCCLCCRCFFLMSVLPAQLCPTLCDRMDCSLLGSSVHGILQARILEWVAYPFSRGSSQPMNRPRNRTRVSCIADGFFTNWATKEAPR